MTYSNTIHTLSFRHCLRSHTVLFVKAKFDRFEIVFQYFKAKVPDVIVLEVGLPHMFVAISEKCVLILKSGKFHINLSFGLAQQCNGEMRKPLNIQ